MDGLCVPLMSVLTNPTVITIKRQNAMSELNLVQSSSFKLTFSVGRAG